MIFITFITTFNGNFFYLYSRLGKSELFTRKAGFDIRTAKTYAGNTYLSKSSRKNFHDDNVTRIFCDRVSLSSGDNTDRNKCRRDRARHYDSYQRGERNEFIMTDQAHPSPRPAPVLDTLALKCPL